jgi:integrase
MKPPTFPIKIPCGNVHVTIYRARFTKAGREYVKYILCYWNFQNQRVQQSFADLKTAKRQANERAIQLANGSLPVLSLKAEAGAAYHRAIQLLRPCGVPLELAAGQFAEAYKILGGGSLIEAAKLAMKAQTDIKPNVSLADTIEEVLKDSELNGARPHHLRVLGGMLRRFSDAFPGALVAAVDGPAIKSFLDGLENVNQRTRNNYRQAIGHVFHKAKFWRYVPDMHKSTEHIAKYRETPGRIEIYSPTEIDLLLNNARPELVPFLAIGAFAGIRHAEIVRLDWKDVSLRERHITVQADNAKTASRRMVPVSDNLALWLVPFEKLVGPVCPQCNINRLIAKLKKNKAIRQSGFEWKQNALRHSFISYRIAELKDVARVALEAGNSPAMIFRHYRELVTAETARAWFGIQPGSDRKIVPMMG